MIQLEKEIFKQMKDHAVRIFPDECCGFFYGNENKEGLRTIVKILEVNNAKPGDKRRRFEITPRDYILGEEFAFQHNLQLLGVYHSHPNHPAIPSEHDRIAAQPFFSYIIISVLEGRINHVRSWMLNNNDQFDEEIISSETINKSI